MSTVVMFQAQNKL